VTILKSSEEVAMMRKVGRIVAVVLQKLRDKDKAAGCSGGGRVE
jgi:Xaa-Pro aminopeptidase